MLKHIVMWKLPEKDKEQNMKTMKEMLEALPPKIEVIKSLAVGINENGGEYDVVLITDFENKHDLESYDGHPEHQKVRKFIRSVVESRIAVDYNY